MTQQYFFTAITQNTFDNGSGYEVTKIVDSELATFGRDNDDGHYCTLTANSCPGTNLGDITNVSVGVYWSNNSTLANIKPRLTPYFGGSNAGDNHDASVDPTSESTFIWEDFDITSDTNAPETWSWEDVQNLDLRMTTLRTTTGRWNPAMARIIVTHNPNGSGWGAMLWGNGLWGFPDISQVIKDAIGGFIPFRR